MLGKDTLGTCAPLFVAHCRTKAVMSPDPFTLGKLVAGFFEHPEITPANTKRKKALFIGMFSYDALQGTQDLGLPRPPESSAARLHKLRNFQQEPVATTQISDAVKSSI